jgi:hypothetical protein
VIGIRASSQGISFEFGFQSGRTLRHAGYLFRFNTSYELFDPLAEVLPHGILFSKLQSLSFLVTSLL